MRDLGIFLTVLVIVVAAICWIGAEPAVFPDGVNIPGGCLSCHGSTLPTNAVAGDIFLYVGSDWAATNGSAILGNTAASVYMSTNHSIISNVVTVVGLDVEAFDLGANYNPTTHVYTVPSTGYYQTDGQINGIQFGDGKRLFGYVYVNGTNEITSASTASAVAQGVYSPFSKLIYCTAGETIDLRGKHMSGASKLIAAGKTVTYLTIIRVR